MLFYPLRYRIYAMVKALMLMDNGGIWKVDGGIEMEGNGNGNANGSGK